MYVGVNSKKKMDDQTDCNNQKGINVSVIFLHTAAVWMLQKFREYVAEIHFHRHKVYMFGSRQLPF